MFTLLDFYSGCMKKLDKRIMDAQIEVFCEWTRRFNIGMGSAFDRQFLELFSLRSPKTDILDVTDEDVQNFIDQNPADFPYPRHKDHAIRILTQMRRFYAARTKNGRQRMVVGRPPRIGEIALAQEYRKKGLKLREISTLMGGKKINIIHRWLKYPLDKILGDRGGEYGLK